MTSQVSSVLPERLADLHASIALYRPATGRIVDANESLRSLYEYSLTELREMDIAEYSANTYSKSQAEIERHIRAAGNGEDQRFRWRIKRGNGELIWVQVSLSQITLDDRGYVLAEINDVTESIYDNRRVRLLTRILRHNLRNDANVITAHAQHIKDKTTSGQIQEHLEMIRRTALDLGGISDSVSQIEQAMAQTDENYAGRRVHTVVSSVVDTYSEQYPDVEFYVDERTEMWVYIDDAFRYALSHAIENAVVHNDQTDIHVGIRIDESPNTGRVELRIVDNGPNIPEMEITALNESTEMTDTCHGAGVGLFVMKWCIESLGGELRIEHNESRGNSVYMYLPDWF